MGVVFEGRHVTLDRRVALKVLHASDETLPGAALQSQRFVREGRAAAQVRHPHVVDVYDFGADDGTEYLVMELVYGETLAQFIAREAPLALAEIAELMLPVASAVCELHAAGIVHRDLKPSNILLARDRTGAVCPKVADFGVSRMDDGALISTDPEAVLGTYPYMSPEQARSSSRASEASDQYSLGIVLYECATGRKPFNGKGPADLVMAIMTAPIKPPSEWIPTLPRRFDEVVLRALSRDRADRYACVDELGEALLGFAHPRIADRWRGEFSAPSTIRTLTETIA